MAAATIAMATAIVAVASATGSESLTWKGGDSLMLTGLAPSDDCGEPPVLRAQLSGTGIDTVAGAFVVSASACLDLHTLRVTDLEATDRFTAGPGPDSSITIRSEDFTLHNNMDSGVLYSFEPVRFEVIDATGDLAGATGGGRYEIALSWPASGGLPQPAHVWFEGRLRIDPKKRRGLSPVVPPLGGPRSGR